MAFSSGDAAFLQLLTKSSNRALAADAASALAGMALKFDPDEPRDDHGRWSLVDAAIHAIEHGAEDAGRHDDRAGHVATHPRRIPLDEADAWGEQHFGSAADLPSDQRRALSAYSHNGYREINRELRGGTAHANAYQSMDIGEATDAIQALDRLMADHQVPEDVTVVRGVGWESFNLEDPKVGDVISDPAYLSTTLDSEDLDYGHPVIMDLDVPKGTHAFYVDGAAKYPEEHELLLDRGLRIVVTDVEPPEGEPDQYGNKPPWRVRAKVIADG